MSLSQKGSKEGVMHKKGCVSRHARNGDWAVGKQIHIHTDPELGLTEQISASYACSIFLPRSTTYKINAVMKADYLIMQPWKGLIPLISLPYKCAVGLP